MHNFDVFDNYECEGQLTIEDCFSEKIPEGIVAVSKIFARARKQMNLAELKTFTYALSTLKFTEENGNKIFLDKKVLAKIVGINSDANHLTEDLKRSIGQLPLHSYIEISDKDHDFYESGVLITGMRIYKNNATITFNKDYMPLFSNLQSDYITMWSTDIFNMQSARSVTFYEDLRLSSDTRITNSKGYGIKALKELFNIPKDGKGSYMRKDGHFDRPAFEKYVIEPLCKDLANCKMISLAVQPDGKLYEKVKKNGRVMGYRFTWNVSNRPKVITADKIENVRVAIDKNPEIIKVAKNIIEGKPKAKIKKENPIKTNSFNNFPQRNYNFDELNKALLENQVAVELATDDEINEFRTKGE